ncbi:MAG: ATP-dependent DNA helicase RecG [Thermogutta sp.]
MNGETKPPATSMREQDPLHQPIQFVKGVGPRRAAILAKLGIETVADALFFFPRSYEDCSDLRNISQLEAGKIQTVIGTVEEVESRTLRGGQTVVGVLIAGEGGYLRAVWFQQPYRRDYFREGQRVMVAGKPRRNGLIWEMTHPRVVFLGGDEEPKLSPIPIYPLTEGIQQWEMRRLIERVVSQYSGYLQEVIPEKILFGQRLMGIQDAVQQIHFPSEHDRLHAARHRFIYEELFVLQVALALKRHQQIALKKAPPLKLTPKIDARIRRLFSFSLTKAQDRAVAEIVHDMEQPIPMNRLLQGDVGSGKTVVAVYAMLLAVANKHQAVLMAPTEILARQHFLTVDRLLEKSRVRRSLLVGGLPAQERAQMLEQIAGGGIDLVVGTQAVIQDEVKFHRLGLVVIDEQHKFGVRQRAALKGAGEEPHYLVMTATPIPRTIALTLFGDLDLTIIDESPPGRKPVRTYLATKEKRGQWWEFFRKKLLEGRQGYVVVPLVEEGDEEVRSVLATCKELSETELSGFRLGIIHGRLSGEEKEKTMAQFREGQIDVLVSTSVVEVGIDVPNATLMTIENAERFGLAQLHQLRGRVSRGKFPGFCCLFSESDSPETQERLKAFCSTTNGFELAEIDFALRGPGELLGTRQHGMAPFRIADILRDKEVVMEARKDAWQLVRQDPGLSRPEHLRLRQMVLRRYGKSFSLADVG